MHLPFALFKERTASLRPVSVAENASLNVSNAVQYAFLRRRYSQMHSLSSLLPSLYSFLRHVSLSRT